MEFYRPCALFCEKVRVLEKRPKSKKRKALEEEVEVDGPSAVPGPEPEQEVLDARGRALFEGRARQAHLGWLAAVRNTTRARKAIAVLRARRGTTRRTNTKTETKDSNENFFLIHVKSFATETFFS
jgi:hypothetical protein